MCVDSELKVINNLHHLFLTASERGLNVKNVKGISKTNKGKTSNLPKPPEGGVGARAGEVGVTAQLDEPKDRQMSRNR